MTPTNNRLVVRLDPPELGRVTVEVLTRADSVHVVMRTEHGAATNALLQQRELIREALERQGLTLGGFDVSEDPNRQAGDPGAARQRAEQGSNRTTDNGPARYATAATNADTEPAMARSTGGLFL